MLWFLGQKLYDYVPTKAVSNYLTKCHFEIQKNNMYWDIHSINTNGIKWCNTWIAYGWFCLHCSHYAFLIQPYDSIYGLKVAASCIYLAARWSSQQYLTQWTNLLHHFSFLMALHFWSWFHCLTDWSRGLWTLQDEMLVLLWKLTILLVFLFSFGWLFL